MPNKFLLYKNYNNICLYKDETLSGIFRVYSSIVRICEN